MAEEPYFGYSLTTTENALCRLPISVVAQSAKMASFRTTIVLHADWSSEVRIDR